MEILFLPLVQDILATGLAGTTCVLTKTNDEALQTTGLLLKNGMPAKLIQSNDGFSLQNLLEVRFLLNEINIGDDVKIITDEVWANAKAEMRKKVSAEFESWKSAATSLNNLKTAIQARNTNLI
jgi:ATP-dependent DNA helicase RecQ